MAENAVVAAYAESDEAALAKEFLRRRLGSRFDEEPISDRKELTRLFRSLARGGLRTVHHRACLGGSHERFGMARRIDGRLCI